MFHRDCASLLFEVASAIGLEFSTTKVATLEIPRERDATSRTREDAQRGSARGGERAKTLSELSRERLILSFFPLSRERGFYPPTVEKLTGCVEERAGILSLSVRRGIFSCGPRCLVAFERLTQRCLGVQTLTQRRHVVPSFSTPWDRGRERGGESKRDGVCASTRSEASQREPVRTGYHRNSRNEIRGARIPRHAPGIQR